MSGKRYIVLQTLKWDYEPTIKGDFDTYDDAVEAIVNNHVFSVYDLFGTDTNKDGTPITKEQLDEKVRDEFNKSIYNYVTFEYCSKTSNEPTYEIKEVDTNVWLD